MSDFVVRGIDGEKYRRFRAVLVGRDETLGEWLEKRIFETIAEEMTVAHTGAIKKALNG